MVLRLYLIVGLVGLMSACSEHEVKSNSFEELTGKEIYLQYCISCHGTSGKLCASGSKDLSTSSLNSDEISEIILNGKDGMPPFKHIIVTEEALAETVEFVESLKR